MRSIAYKRAKRQKYLNRCRFIAKSCFSLEGEAVEHCAQRIYANRKRCSCQMCRNPRRCHWNSKLEKKTIQERKFQQIYSSGAAMYKNALFDLAISSSDLG